MWDVKYRPKTFGEVLGQEGPVQVLKSRLRKGTGLDTSYIFSGGHGQGKTTLARILARALLCQDLREDGEPCNECDNCMGILTETSMAFTELDAASKGTIDNIRSIVDDLPFAVPGARKRLYLFDEAHRMSKDAQDVLLKPVEDKALIAILCTTEPEKIRGTIRSRCEEHGIRKITREEVLGRMRMVLETEGVTFEEDAVLIVIDYCGGHVRDILNKLEMVSQLGAVTTEAVRERLNLSVVSTYYEILLSLGDPAKAIELVEQACDRVGPEEVASGLAEAAMSSYRLVHKMHTDFALMDRELAVKVHKVFGDRVIDLARYFLAPRKATTISLVCDVVRCAEGVPAPAATQAPAPRVVVQAPAPAPRPAEEPSQPAPEPAERTSDPPPAPEDPPTPPAQETAPEPKVGPKPVKEMGKVGPVGSELDDRAIPDSYPRRRDDNPHHQVRTKGARGSGQQTEDLLTPAQWAREFADTWTGRGTGG